MKQYEFESIPVRVICPHCESACYLYLPNINNRTYQCDHCGESGKVDNHLMAIVTATNDLEESL